MSTADDKLRLRLARQIADQALIDWEAELAEHPDARESLERLRRAEQFAVAFRSNRATVYEDLRELGRQLMATLPPGASLHPATLVRNAYRRLVGANEAVGSAEFFPAAAQGARRLVLEQAQRLASEPGAGWLPSVARDVRIEAPTGDILLFDAALERLRAYDPRKADVVMLRVFAGLTNADASRVLARLERDVERDWEFARAILYDDVVRGAEAGPRVNPDRWAELESIFRALVDRSPVERAQVLTNAFESELELRAVVERLLRHHDGGMGAFLETPGPGESPASIDGSNIPTAGESFPDQIGPYRLLEVVGVGGMGEVYRAEQTGPIQRTVAFKLVKRGMDTKDVIARFEAERQALALMDHPVIAKVFDAGSTPGGRPYFAMEYVSGVPITTFCDEHRLTTRERLELFIQLCDGVQHAHQKAIIHRDLKPSNVLVTIQDRKPVPKIIDFGVAKATAQRLTEKTMYTALGEMIGTPEYMSPEQASLTGEDVDTRTDVYALGVILYELLAGSLPFEPSELRKAGFAEIIRTIRERDPPRPSTKVATLGERADEVAKARRTNPGKLTTQLRGDLDWIVVRALEKDRTRRYGSPSDLAAEVRRHLNHEPVLAGRPSIAYRTRKFVRRHTLGVAVAAAFLLVIAASAVALSVLYYRAETQAEIALEETEIAREMEAAADARAKVLEQTTRKLYFGQIAAAQAAYDRGDILRFRALLDGCPAELRGWEWKHLNYLRLLLDKVGPTLGAHEDRVWSVAVSPDGTRVTSGGADGVIKVWDVATGREKQILLGHTGYVQSVAFSPTGDRIVSGSSDNTIKIWDAAAGGEPVRTLVGHQGAVLSVAFSPDGTRIASGSSDKTVKVWDAATGKELRSLPGDMGGQRITSVAFSPQGTRIAFGIWLLGRTPVRVWDLDTGSVQDFGAIRAGHSVESVAFSPDGTTIVAGGINTISLCDAATGRELATLTGHAGPVRSVNFSPDGERIVSGSEDKTVKIWDATTREELFTLRGHEDAIFSAAFLVDGKRIVSGSRDGTVRLWQAGGRKEWLETPPSPNLSPPPGGGTSVLFSPDDKWVVAAGASQQIRVWDVASGLLEAFILGSDDAAFSPDGETLASCRGDTVLFWDVATWQKRSALAVGMLAWNVEFSPDGTTLAVIVRTSETPRRNAVQVWKRDDEVWRPHSELKTPALDVVCMAFSPNGQLLALGGNKPNGHGDVVIMDVVTGKELLNFPGRPGEIYCVAFSPDGSRIISGGSVSIRVWDYETHALRFRPIRVSRVISLTVSPDGKRIVAGFENGTVRMWDAESGDEALSLGGGSGWVQDLAFSSDGKYLVSSDRDKVNIWRSARSMADLTDRIRVMENRVRGLTPHSSDWPFRLRTAYALVDRWEESGRIEEEKKLSALKELIQRNRQAAGGSRLDEEFFDTIEHFVVTPERWLIVGPFPSGRNHDGLDHLYPPEETIDPEGYDGPSGRIRWQPLTVRRGPAWEAVNLAQTYRESWYGVAYALAYIHAEKEQLVTLRVQSVGAVKIWLNDRMVYKNRIDRTVFRAQDQFPLKLTRGTNKLLVKTKRMWGYWGFDVDVLDERGWPARVTWSTTATP